MWDQAGRDGQILCGRQFMNSLADSSLEEIKAAINDTPWLKPHFDIGEKYVKTISGRISYTFVGLDRNVDSVKSKARILLGWIDEAEPVTDEAWSKLIPTLREEDSELWVTWNPERKNSATNKRFRVTQDPRAKIVELNWRDNPWFPAILDRKRLADKEARPEQYDHIWEGDFVSASTGAYYAKSLTEAKEQRRIGALAKDPLLPIKAFWDIGVADATAIWIAQWIGREIRVLDYYEATRQPLATHLQWLRSNGYEHAECYLPHDAAHQDAFTAIRFEDHIRSAGFDVTTIPNQGKGAAIKRVEAARRLFGNIWFDQTKCAAGLEALGWYHERQDENRGIGLGPEHDWSSHGADAFGLMCVAYDEPAGREPERFTASIGGWMG